MQKLSGQEIYQKIYDSIETVIRGQQQGIRQLLAAFLSGGHVLLEDYPGTGKTTLAKTLAYCLEASFKRIQFTPDLLPSDILGVSIFDQKEQLFNFHEGPIFAHIVLADEINRASPRTQSALLEAMAETQVSVDGQVRPLPQPFFVIATQNPVESHGTYPLPEAQMDRFALKFSLGYLPPEEEVKILAAQIEGHPITSLQPCLTLKEINLLRQQVKQIRISEELKRYIVDIVYQTRCVNGVQLGASPRASIALMKIAQALALFDDCEFVTPEHIQELAVPTIAHRLVMDTQAKFSGQTAEMIVEEIVRSLKVPS
ncbi:MAG: AAA family ATPase [Microcystaceae cyanobacterium]